jgi:hypothetical protein
VCSSDLFSYSIFFALECTKPAQFIIARHLLLIRPLPTSNFSRDVPHGIRSHRSARILAGKSRLIFRASLCIFDIEAE